MQDIQGIDGASILSRPGLCAILYGATWCQSSLRLRDALALHPDLPLLWADIDICQDRGAADGVRGIPTLVVRRDGIPEAHRVAIQDPADAIEWLATHGLIRIETLTGRRRMMEHFGLKNLFGSSSPAAAQKI